MTTSNDDEAIGLRMVRWATNSFLTIGITNCVFSILTFLFTTETTGGIILLIPGVYCLWVGMRNRNTPVVISTQEGLKNNQLHGNRKLYPWTTLSVDGHNISSDGKVRFRRFRYVREDWDHVIACLEASHVSSTITTNAVPAQTEPTPGSVLQSRIQQIANR